MKKVAVRRVLGSVEMFWCTTKRLCHEVDIMVSQIRARGFWLHDVVGLFLLLKEVMVG